MKTYPQRELLKNNFTKKELKRAEKQGIVESGYIGFPDGHIEKVWKIKDGTKS